MYTIELKKLKTYIETNLTSEFIRPFRSPEKENLHKRGYRRLHALRSSLPRREAVVSVIPASACEGADQLLKMLGCRCRFPDIPS